MWFDSHCHLYDLGIGNEPADAVRRARAASVGDVLIPGVDPASSRQAIDLAVEHGLWAAVGIHPSEAGDRAGLSGIEELLEHPRVVAIGETGLDFYREGVARELQETNFIAHIDLARRTTKALIVHTRASASAALDLLEHHGLPESVIFHCWSGAEDELQRALSMGAFISFAGNVSFKNAQPLRDAACSVPADRLLIETDAPYLTPVPHRGKPNEPAYVALVGEAVAAARQQSLEEVAAVTSANAKRSFALA